MKRLLSIFIVLQLVSCESSQNTSGYEAPDISGHWRLAHTEVVKYIPFLDQHALEDSYEFAVESSPYEFAGNHDMIFSLDSFYLIDYPVQLHTAGKYSIDTSHLNFIESSWPIHVKGDTMLLYCNDEPYHFLKLEYYRTHFDSSTVSILKRDTINYEGLAGTWMLLRGYSYMYGYQYTLDFPHEIPDSVVLTREETSSTSNGDRSVEVLTDGMKRKYTFSYIDGQLHLTPGSWYSGKDPNIHFWREKE